MLTVTKDWTSHIVHVTVTDIAQWRDTQEVGGDLKKDKQDAEQRTEGYETEHKGGYHRGRGQRKPG